MAHDDGVGARDMRFTFSNLPAVGWKLPLRDIVAMASRCEAVGFARFAVADLQFHYDVVAVMTACVAGTSRLAIESLVTNPYTRDATLLACAWAAMADLSGGRVIFGIGGGVEVPKRVWVSPFGHERPHSTEAVRECIGVVRRLWRGERVTFDGKVVHVHDVSRSTIDALAKGWDMWRDPRLPDELGALIGDDVLDQFTVWGEPEECAARLRRLADEAPGATGFRLKLPLPIGTRTLADYLADAASLAEVIASYRGAMVTA